MFAGTVTGIASQGTYQSGTGINLTSVDPGGTGYTTGIPSQGTYVSGTGINLNAYPGSGGTWGLDSGQQVVSYAPGSYPSAQPTYSYASWISPYAPAYSPGFASRGPLGEGGPYTELDYPEMRFLRAGENPTELLTSLRQQQAKAAMGKVTPVGWAALLIIGLGILKR